MSLCCPRTSSSSSPALFQVGHAIGTLPLDVWVSSAGFWEEQQLPCGGNPLWPLVSVTLFFWSPPEAHDHRWVWEWRSTGTHVHITADAAPIRLSVSHSVCPSQVNKTPRYLNSSTLSRVSPPTRSGQATSFWFDWILWLQILKNWSDFVVNYFSFMKITQTVERIAVFHQEPHGNSTWFQQLTIEETPPADLLQTFQPNLAREVLLLVIIQTSSVQHDISIYSLARKGCDRLRLGQSAAGLILPTQARCLEQMRSKRAQRKESCFVSLVENKPSGTTPVFSFQQQRTQKLKSLWSNCVWACVANKRRNKGENSDDCTKHTKTLVFCYEGVQLDSLIPPI